MRAVCFDLDDTLGRYASDFSAFLALVRNELALHQCDMNAFARLVSEEMRRDGPLTFELVLRRVLERLQQRPPADLAALTRAALAAQAGPPGVTRLIVHVVPDRAPGAGSHEP